MSSGKLPLRRDIPEKLTWDLLSMYAKESAWDDDFAKLPELLEAFTAWRGKLNDSPAAMKSAIEALDALERLGEKLYTYAHLRSDENTADSANRSRLDRIGTYFATVTAACAWLEPEVMAIPEARMEELLKSPELAFYERSLRELLRERAHTLSEPEERILGEFSDVMGSAAKTFSTLNDADMVFKPIRGDKGEKLEVTHGNYRKLLENPDRKLRRKAFRSMFQAYKGLEHTFATTLDYTVKEHAVEARIRKHPNALAAALFEDNIPESVYLNLIAAVNAKLPALHDYYELRSRVLKLKKPDVYDLYTPLVPKQHRKYTWKEAVKLVKEALKPLGDEYSAILERAFKERWVDVMECKGKRSGAYSSGCYDSNPYLLLNYHGTLNDVFTLAHELGHSLHSHYSNKHQQYHYAGYSIFAAEVASITNELLLNHYLMRNTSDPDFQAYLLNHMADEARGTIFRQTMFAEFELAIHRRAEAGEPLVSDLLNREYFELNKKYLGPRYHADLLIEVEWARIPHFYYDFYVYKYATGMAAAIQLSSKILSQSDGVTPYLNFLKAGDSKDVLDILDDAGVDLRKVEVIEAALDNFAATVQRLKALLK